MKQLIQFAIAIFIVIAVSSSAMAIGIGVYGEFQRGTTVSRSSFNISSDDIGVFGGVVLDTNVAKNDLFNYRVRLGAGQSWASKTPVTRVSLVQAFGVSPAPLRGDFARFWFGPRIGLHYINAKFRNENDAQMMTMMTVLTGYPVLFPEQKLILNLFKADIGLVIAGFNFNFGPVLTLSFEMGFDYGFTVGKARYETAKTKIDASGEGIEGFATLAVIFRIQDNYSKQPVDTAPERQEKKMQIQLQQ